MAKRSATPVYLQIAVDVANKIISGKIKKEGKISGRSTLAGEYNVSPETIRKAMALLSDVEIVEVKQGTGIYVKSVENAEEFIRRYEIRSSINELKEEMHELIKQRETIEDKMNETMNAIIDYTSRFKNSEYVKVFEYYLNDEECNIYGKTLNELKMWENTGVTIVGIKREGKTILSPSHEEIIRKNDRLLYVGEPLSSIRLGDYIRTH
jgi:K+/H+ antiporter YhaU regulatory subunit KhtT